MNTRLFCFLALAILSIQVSAQSKFSLGVRAGVMLGGPIPTEMDPDSSSGSLAVGPSAGAFVRWQPADRWRIEAGLSYAYKGASYQQWYRNDTMMALEILPGIVDTVPTYYYADVDGRMGLHYLDLPVLVQFRVNRHMWVQAGPYVSALLGGKDAGSVDIQIGNGQVFPDTSTTYDNIQEIRRIDWGACLGGTFEWESGLFLEAKAQRSFRGLYRPGFMSSQGLPETKLFHTQFYFGIGWQF